MKVQSVQLKYFKKFDSSPEFDFTDPETELARDMIILVGTLGAGKTSLLQAIAATLITATGRLQKIYDLDWTGFNYELISNNWGKFEPEVTVKVQFSTPELQAIHNLQKKFLEMGRGGVKLVRDATSLITTLKLLVASHTLLFWL